jgi:hypothetical protein
MELLRFSVWKKELIEKQQTLYKLLKQHNGKDSELSDGEIVNEASDSEEDDLSTRDSISSDEINDIQHNGNDEEEEELETSSEDEEELDDAQISSEHEPDSDFEVSLHHRRHQSKNLIPETPPKKVDLRCKVCNATFIARQGLVRHETFCRPNKLAGRRVVPKKIKINKEAKFRCFCNERFTSFRALNIHRTRKHGKHTNMSWDVIDEQNELKSSSSSMRVGSSSKLHDGRIKSSPKKMSFKCNFCPYRTESNKLLKYHLRANHSDSTTTSEKSNSKLQCDECFKQFSCYSALRMHIVTVHHDVRP